MLSLTKSPRQRSSRPPFRAPLWDDHHPAFRRLDSALPADHHARWLATVVSRLDLTTLRLSYAGYGARAFPVELLLAFVLFMYSQGLLSPAEWARQARYDDRSKWLLRGLRPSRSQLYTFRDRVEPFLDGWHQQLIAWALVEGITTAARGSLDGTFVAALASRHQLVGGDRLDRRLWLLRLLVWLDGSPGPADLADRLGLLPQLALTALALTLTLLHVGVQAPSPAASLLPLLALLELLALTPAGQPRPPAWVPHSAAGRRRVLGRYEDARRRLARRLEPYQRKQKPSQKDLKTMKRLKVSLTDPEAALGFDKLGTYRPLYNVPLVQATDAPLTLAWEVLARNNDDGLLKPMMERTQHQVGRPLQEVLIDGGFVSVGEVAWCEQERITVYAPPAQAQAVGAAVSQAVAEQAQTAVAAEQETAAASNGPSPAKLPKEAFRYDSAEQVYYCPEGKRLAAASRTTLKRSNGIELPMIVHRASREDCQACPRQPSCTSSTKTGRTVKRYEGEEALQRLQQRMAEPSGQEVYKLRGRSVELGYADIKEHRGLRVFRCFGRKRARAQAGLVILSSNGLKIMNILHRRPKIDPHPPPPVKQPA
jgi:transposase